MSSVPSARFNRPSPLPAGGNGALVKKESGGETTVYAGSYYEKNVTTGQATKYYFFAGQRIAMRKEGVLYYLAGDHLGTTSVVLDASGNKVAESRHYPYGVERWSSGALPTDYRFTGQRFEAGLGIYVMGVRWYDPYINRFLSPDSIIPQPANPQSLNRFSYALGNPLRYRDPTGHWEEEWEEQFEQEHGRPATEQDWWDYQFSLQIENWIAACWEQTYQLRTLLWGAEVTIKAGDIKWTIAQAEVVGEAVQRIADRFDGNVRPFIGGLIVILKTNTDPWWAPLWRWWNKQPADFRFGGYEQGGKIYMRADNVNVGGLLHEMGHYYDEEDRLSRAYQKHVKQAGLDIQTNRFEDFANAFRDYVLGNLMAAARRDYFDQLRVQQDSE